MHKIEVKLDLLRINFFRNYTLILILRQFVIGFINFFFNNFFYVFIDAICVSILATFLFLQLKFPMDFNKIGKIGIVFLLIVNILYGTFSRDFIEFVFYNSFVFALSFYLFFCFKKTVLLTLITLVIFPLNKLNSFYTTSQLTLSEGYESSMKFASTISVLILFLVFLYYYTEIKRNVAVIDFLEEEERKSLEANIKKTDTTNNEFYKILFAKIDSFMKKNEPWRNAEYNLDELAKELNLNVFQVSTAINYCNKSNFKTYLNEFRLNAIEKELKKNTNGKILLKQIYLDIGFNSRVTFNRTFKNKFGKTPQEYLQDENFIHKE